MRKLIFPLTGVNQGVEMRFEKDNEIIVIDRATGERSVHSDGSPELASLIGRAKERFASLDTHRVEMSDFGRSTEVKFRHDGTAIRVDFKLDNSDENQVYLYQIISQSAANATYYLYGDDPYQATLDSVDWRSAEAALDLKGADDLKALLDRVGAWIAWSNQMERVCEVGKPSIR